MLWRFLVFVAFIWHQLHVLVIAFKNSKTSALNVGCIQYYFYETFETSRLIFIIGLSKIYQICVTCYLGLVCECLGFGAMNWHRYEKYSLIIQILYTPVIYLLCYLTIFILHFIYKFFHYLVFFLNFVSQMTSLVFMSIVDQTCYDFFQ